MNEENWKCKSADLTKWTNSNFLRIAICHGRFSQAKTCLVLQISCANVDFARPIKNSFFCQDYITRNRYELEENINDYQIFLGGDVMGGGGGRTWKS